MFANEYPYREVWVVCGWAIPGGREWWDGWHFVELIGAYDSEGTAEAAGKAWINLPKNADYTYDVTKRILNDTTRCT